MASLRGAMTSISSLRVTKKKGSVEMVATTLVPLPRSTPST